jgi:hypothetical protein
VGVQLIRKMTGTLWQVVCVVSWCLLGLWTSLALFFTVHLTRWPAAILAVAIFVEQGQEAALQRKR